ncbi:MAG: carboxypeptidase-like regulatory domain-containing protein [Muribaculaceae bacterium]
MSGVLDEDGYIGIEFAYEYIDNYKNIPLLPNTVSGTIKAKDGVTTISGATVDLLDGSGNVAYYTTSGADGTYTFGETVADGDYTLRVTADGYLTYTAEAATTISDDKTDLDASLDPKPVNYYNFGGTVFYNGEAVEGMWLNLVGGDTDMTCTTKEDGAFSFIDVLEGTYTLTVDSESAGYKPYTKTITLDREITDHEVELSKYKLSGSVIYRTGEGDEDYVRIKGASVVLKQKQGDTYTEIGSATTVDGGAFTFSELSGGDYTLTASADGFVTTESEPIGLNSDADVDQQLVLEWSKSTISGTVMRNDVDVNAALAGITVELRSGEDVKTTTSDADGAYSLVILGQLAEDGYKLHVDATDYFQEFTSDVTPEYQGTVTKNIGLDPVLLEYVAVIENEDGEALEGAAITVAKAAPKQIIDSFEYLANYSGAAKEGLLANGWLAVSNSGSLSPDRSAAYQKDGQWSLKMASVSDFYCIIVRAAKAGTVSIWTLQETYAGQVEAYKMKDNGDGTYSIDGSVLASKTTSANWAQLSFTLDEDCFIGFKIKGSYIDYYVNDYGTSSTAAPAYAAPALAEESGDTPSTIKITKDPIDLKTFTIAIPKVDYVEGTYYTATASATGATLKDTGASEDVWEFTFSEDETQTHTSVFVGGTPTGVSDISVDSTDADEAEYYTLQGVRVTNPQSGIYIRRTATAATKVLIR